MPDPEDAVDRILLREAAPTLARARAIVVIDDESAALVERVAAATEPGTPVRAYTDSATTERALAAAAARQSSISIVTQLDAELLAETDLVLLRLPKSLAALDEIAVAVSRWAAPAVELYAGGRVKHMSRGMNTQLGRHFSQVRASLGQQKARVLVASDPRPGGTEPPPRTQHHEDLRVTLCAYGGTFAGSAVDLGSRLLVGCFDRLPDGPETVVDLGSGSGLLAVLVARRQPAAAVIAVDDSRAAVRSTLATAQANRVSDRVQARHTDRLHGLGSGSVDLVVCNPPFHRGAARDTQAAYAMFADAARVLRPGGELWVVYNSHLPYLDHLRRLLGRTVVLAQDPHFTVARAVRRQGQLRLARASDPCK